MTWHIILKTFFSLVVLVIVVSTAKDLVTDAPEKPATPSGLRAARLLRILVDIAIIVWFWVP